jgi:hypothetical protein
MAGITFSTAILAAPNTPQRTFLFTTDTPPELFSKQAPSIDSTKANPQLISKARRERFGKGARRGGKYQFDRTIRCDIARKVLNKAPDVRYAKN